MEATGLYFLNGLDMFTAYGFVPEPGVSNDILRPRKRKEPYSNDWPDEDGKEYDLSAPPKFEDKQIRLNGHILANSEVDFWTKYNALIAAFNAAGVSTLRCNELTGKYGLYGGINLLTNSAGPFTSAGNNEYTKIGVHALFATLVGKTVTISFKLKSAIEGSFQFYTLGRYGIGSTIFQATTDFQQYKKTVTITDVNPAQTFTDLSFFGTYGTGRILTVKEVKIEYGNQGTMWSPAVSEVANPFIKVFYLDTPNFTRLARIKVGNQIAVKIELLLQEVQQTS